MDATRKVAEIIVDSCQISVIILRGELITEENLVSVKKKGRHKREEQRRENQNRKKNNQPQQIIRSIIRSNHHTLKIDSTVNKYNSRRNSRTRGIYNNNTTE